MTEVGKLASLWRYPVKSMRGEELEEAFVGFSGLYGDRLYAFKSAACEKMFPYLTAREQARMLLYRPAFRNPALACKPENLTEAESFLQKATNHVQGTDINHVERFGRNVEVAATPSSSFSAH